jgi:dihydroorotase
MSLILKNVRAVDPQIGLDDVVSIRIEGDKIAEVGSQVTAAESDTVRDLSGKVLVPGLVDIHVHLREPGQEYKEDIESGTRAAAAGGFTAVCCMPNTAPAIDNGAMVEAVKGIAAAKGHCRVHVAGCCTKGREGAAIAEMGDMVERGAVAFTDDGCGVADAGAMRRVMDYANQFGKVVMSHCQDAGLVGNGQVNEGVASTRLALAGWPAEGEEIQIARDILIANLTGTPLHIQHLTTARGLDIVREAKAKGVKVTCEVTPHHLFLNEEALDETYDTNFKVNPPLRTQDDNDALVEGIVDGTIDCIVTDHAPHAKYEKDRPFELAPFGMTGIETSLSLVLTQLVSSGVIDYNRMVELMAVNPRAILGVEPVKLEAGSTADLTVFDPACEWTVTADGFQSKSANSGFLGAHLTGKATDVYVGGAPTLVDGKIA